jgi:hypothetical protein
MLLACPLLAQMKRQAVPLANAPEMSNLPWVIVFLDDQWQADALSTKVVTAFQSPELADVTQVRSRFHILTASHPRTPGYARYHLNQFPAVVVAAPDPQKVEDIWACIRRAGMEIAAESPEQLRANLNLIVQDPSLRAEDERAAGSVEIPPEEDAKQVGRPALFPRFWNDPPYVARPWLWGTNRDWDGSSDWFGMGSGGCNVANTPARPPAPAPTPNPAPVPPIYQYQTMPVQDTGLLAKIRELEAKIKEKETSIKDAANTAGGVMSAFSFLSNLGSAGSIVNVVLGLAAGAVSLLAGRRFLANRIGEDDE